MIDQLPFYITAVFVAATFYTLFIIYWSVKSVDSEGSRRISTYIILGFITWLIIQGILSKNNYYLNYKDSIPPKIFLFGVIPNILLILSLFLLPGGKAFIDRLCSERLTYIHIVRIPIELVLFWLFVHEAIPSVLTFEGWNYDIIMGLTAPLVLYFGYHKNAMKRSWIIGWNVVGIVLLTFVFVMAVLSAPFPLQQLAFDQPNVGLLQYPFSWLPTFIVPMVILSHLISIRELLKSSKKESSLS